MCKWCENYRFTINATSKKNLIDHGDFYVPANYCPVCGTLLNENLKKDNDLNKRFIICVKPDIICIKSNAKEHEIPTEGQNYYHNASGLHHEEVVFGKKEEAYLFKTYFEAKCTADWFFNEEDYEIEEIVSPNTPKESSTKKSKERVYFAKIKVPIGSKEDQERKVFYKGATPFGDKPILTDEDGAKYFGSTKALKEELDWFYKPEDYIIIFKDIVKMELPDQKDEKKEKLPHFTKDDFYYKSDSGSVISTIYDRNTNKNYEFSSKTIDKFNQIIDKLNSL